MNEKGAREIYDRGVQFCEKNPAPQEMTKRFYRSIGYLEAIDKAKGLEIVVMAVIQEARENETDKGVSPVIVQAILNLAKWEKER